jgi:hypothetical protein
MAADMIFRFSVYTRLLVCARRISRSLISIDESLKVLAMCAKSDWEARNAPRPKARTTEFSTVNITDIEERYKQDRIAQGLDPDDL